MASAKQKKQWARMRVASKKCKGKGKIGSPARNACMRKWLKKK